MYNVVSSNSYTLLHYVVINFFFYIEIEDLNKVFFQIPHRRFFFLHLICELLEQLSVIDEASPQCWHLLLFAFMRALWASRSVFLREINLKVVQVSLSFSKQTKELVKTRYQLSAAWAEADLQVQVQLCQLCCECGGSTVLWKVVCKTGECWLQTACAHNQFLLFYFSFVSFVHPVCTSLVLHTKFMTRCH